MGEGHLTNQEGTRIAIKPDSRAGEIVVSEFRGRSTRSPIRVGRVKTSRWWQELNAESMARYGRLYLDLNERDEVQSVRDAVGRRHLSNDVGQ